MSSKVFNQFDLLIGKGANLLAEQAERSDQFVVLQHWDGKKGPYAPQFDGFDIRRAAFLNVLLFRCKIEHVN